MMASEGRFLLIFSNLFKKAALRGEKKLGRLMMGS